MWPSRSRSSVVRVGDGLLDEQTAVSKKKKIILMFHTNKTAFHEESNFSRRMDLGRTQATALIWSLSHTSLLFY